MILYDLMFRQMTPPFQSLRASYFVLFLLKLQIDIHPSMPQREGAPVPTEIEIAGPHNKQSPSRFLGVGRGRFQPTGCSVRIDLQYSTYFFTLLGRPLTAYERSWWG